MGDTVSPDELLQALGAALQPDLSLRQQGEAYIIQAHLRPGCALALLQIVAEPRVDIGLRQLAAVVLRQHIKRHWTRDDQAFAEPEVSAAEKEAIRASILTVLFQVPSGVCTALGVCVAAIANWEFPDQWPDVLPTLLNAITAKPNGAAAAAAAEQQRLLLHCREVAMSTLSLMAESMDDPQLPVVLSSVLPVLLAGCEQGTMAGPTLQLALSVVSSCIKSMTVMEPGVRKELRKVLRQHLEPLTRCLCGLISAEMTDCNARECAIRQEALKIVQELVMHLGKPVQAHVSSAMQAIWKFFKAAPRIFEQSVLQGQGEAADEQGTASFESVVEQLYEFLLTALGSRKFEAYFTGALEELLYHTITFMQITPEQEEAWASDPNCYVADEDQDAFCARSSCEMLLTELQSSFESHMTATMNKVCQQRLAEANALRAKNDPNWWRIREASLYAVGTQVSLLDDTGASGVPEGLEVGQILQDVLTNDLTPADVPPFLQGRALWVAAKLGRGLPKGEAAGFLAPAVAGLQPRNELPVRIGACRALAQLFRLADASAIAPFASQAYAALLQLLQEVQQDVLNLVLETLQAVVKEYPQGATEHAAAVTSLLVKIFPTVANDVNLVDAITDLITALSKPPGCLKQMAEVGVPMLIQLLHTHAPVKSPQSSYMLEGTLDLLCSFVCDGHKDVSEAMYNAVGKLSYELIMTSGEANVMQSGCTIFQRFLRVGGEELLTWAGNTEQQSLQMLHGILAHVLKPENEDGAAMYVADLALQTLRSLPSHAPAIAPQLLKLLMAKLFACETQALRGQLLVVICRILIEQDVDAQLALLSQCNMPAERGDTLTAFFECWMDNAMDVCGEFQLRLTASGIAKILCSRHSSLSTIQVKGKPEVDRSAGVRTRAQARSKGLGLSYSQVPLPVAMMRVVVKLLREADDVARQRNVDWTDLLYAGDGGIDFEDDDDDEDDAWEDADGSDADGDEGAADDVHPICDLGRAFDRDPALLMRMADCMEDDDADVMQVWQDDPLYKQDVVHLTKEALRGLMHSDEAYFKATLSALDDHDLAYLTAMFESPAAA